MYKFAHDTVFSFVITTLHLPIVEKKFEGGIVLCKRQKMKYQGRFTVTVCPGSESSFQALSVHVHNSVK